MVIKSRPFALIGGVHVHPVLPPWLRPCERYRLIIIDWLHWKTNFITKRLSV